MKNTMFNGFIEGFLVPVIVLFVVLLVLGINALADRADQERNDFWESKCLIEDIEGERIVVPCSELSYEG